MIDTNRVELFSSCTNVTMMQAIGLGTRSLVRTSILESSQMRGPDSGKEGRKRNATTEKAPWWRMQQYFRIYDDSVTLPKSRKGMRSLLPTSKVEREEIEKEGKRGGKE